MKLQVQNKCVEVEGYKINSDKPLGSGDTGSVFDCESQNPNKEKVCAKIIPIKDQNFDYGMEQKICELIQNKQNENLVKIHYAKFVKLDQVEKLIIIMERCEKDLEKQLQNKVACKDEFIEDFLNQFLKGYQFLYNQNIIHRDLKPANILTKEENGKLIYKISDFGCGRFYKKNDFKISQIGTAAYQSPEMNYEFKDQDLQKQFAVNPNKSCVDIFSLGIILHRMVKGSLPFEPNAHQIIAFYNQIKQKPLTLEGPSKFLRYIEKMLRFQPSERLKFEELFDVYLKIAIQKTITFPNQSNNPIDIKGQKSNPFKVPQLQQSLQSIQKQNQQSNAKFTQQTSISEFDFITKKVQQNPINFPNQNINQFPNFEQKQNTAFEPRSLIINFLSNLLVIHSKILQQKVKDDLQEIIEKKDVDDTILKKLISYFEVNPQTLDHLDTFYLQFYYSLLYLNKININQKQLIINSQEEIKKQIIKLSEKNNSQQSY